MCLIHFASGELSSLFKDEIHRLGGRSVKKSGWRGYEDLGKTIKSWMENVTVVEELGRGGWRAEGGVNLNQLSRLERKGRGWEGYK